MSDYSADLLELRAELAQLTRRVYQLEAVAFRSVGTEPAPAPPAAAAAPPTPLAPPPRPQPAVPVASRPLPPPAAARAPVVRTPQPITDWHKLGEQVFTARTLAWAGGVATALGIVLLFVLAAARGWVTPAMRIGLGTIVSLGLVGCAVELDRRRWRADAILAAAGAGIAGLYATLWAASTMFGFVGAPGAAGLAAAIAALAVVVGIRIKQEPLALFGIGGAMVAPLLVSGEVSAAAVLYASAMMAAAIVLHVRLGWLRLMGAAWLIGLAEALALAAAPETQVGFGAAVVALAVVTSLIIGMLFAIELRPSLRPRITPLGWPVASSALALSLIGAAVYAGDRDVAGHSLAGVTLAGLALAWALLAAVPSLVRRPHPDLTDTLAAFALAIAATSTGLLAGGPGRACAWAAESAVLVLLAERIARRSGTRRTRLTIASGAYLVLATVATLMVAGPTADHLPTVGAGSIEGTIALVALAAAGVVYCYGTRWIAPPGRVALWAVPGVTVGYLPAWALPAEQAVIAYAALAAALFVYRRTPWMVGWLRDEAALVIASCWWLVGAVVALTVASPLSELAAPDFSGLGAGNGMAGLVALAAAGGVLTWSLRHPRQAHAEYALLVPSASVAYLVAEALAAPHTMWAWLILAGTAAALVHMPLVRRTLGASPLMAASAGLLGLGTVVAWNYDESLQALRLHGQSSGWQSIALAVAASLLLAAAELDPRRRSYLLWLPYLLTAQLSAMLLPGQYPLVAMAGLSMAVSACAIAWPAPLRSRLDRAAVTELGVFGAIGVAVTVPLAYETPSMLFQTSQAPAAGLAAAIAATAALFVAAAAARTRRGWLAFGIPVAKTLVYTAGAAALWTLAAAILGASEYLADASSPLSVHDRFQQGHVVVSVGWVLIGLALVVLSLRGDHRGLRVGGIALLFVALGKLFVYDLAYLTAMARAVSFIVTGSVLLLAALLLARFAPQVKAALGDEPVSGQS